MTEEKPIVNHPPHYNQGKIEVIDFIEDQGLGFNLGNAVKYIARAEHKGKEVEDLEKALWYVKRELERRNGTLITTTMRNFDDDLADERPLDMKGRDARTHMGPHGVVKVAMRKIQEYGGEIVPDIDWSKIPNDVFNLEVRQGEQSVFLFDTDGDDYVFRPHNWQLDRDAFPSLYFFVGRSFTRFEDKGPR